jgi:type II secretory pathway pseudopilin PulG
MFNSFSPLGGIEAKWIIAGVVAAGAAVAVASKDKSTSSSYQEQQAQQAQAQQQQAAQNAEDCPAPPTVPKC